MRLLKNFTIRIVMLAILGLFCLLWSGVGLFSLHSLSKISEGNDIDRHLVHQMTVLSQGNDQYFRFVTRLSRAMDVKMSGGTPDFAPAQQSLENMSKKLQEMKTLSPGPMDPEVAAAVLTKWQAAGQWRDPANAVGKAGHAHGLCGTCQYHNASAEP